MKNNIFLLLCLITLSVKAQRNINVNRIPVSSLQTLLLTPNASSGALGGAGVASTPDVSLTTLNVAKNAFFDNKNGISLSYMPNETRLIRGMYMLNLSGYIGLKEKIGTISYNLMNYSYASTELRDNDANFLGNQSSNDMSLKVGYSKKLAKKISAGTGIGIYRSNIFGSQSLLNNYFKPATGVNADLGFYRNGFDTNKDVFFNYGVSIVNIGGKLNYGDVKIWSYAPMQFRAGFSAVSLFGDEKENKFEFLFDITKDLIPTPNAKTFQNTQSSLSYLFTSWGDAPNGLKEEMQELRFHFGAEYFHKNLLGIRVGYQHESKYKGDRKQLGLGLGLKNIGTDNLKFNLDASYNISVSTGIAPTFRISLSTFFGGVKDYTPTDDEMINDARKRDK